MSVIVIMPAYNAAKTLEVTYASIPMEAVDKVILTDDVSQDETVEIARQLGFSHFHTFKYSTRTGTRAERMPEQVPEAVKQERSQIIRV